uniref:Chemotaxis protein CheW n=1 Tax=candidate division WOR-3 bacterium TaxID=2052148 RepID=A0A7C3N6T7_UNCW3
MANEQYITFKIEGKIYGINISDIIDIYEKMNGIRIPNAQDYIESVINLRGDVVVLISLKKKLKINKKVEENYIIICEKDKEKYGLLVDNIEGIINVTKVKEEESEGEYIKGFVEKDGKEIIILNLKNIINKN